MSDIKRKPHLWCLYEKNERRLVEGLLFDEARAIVSSLSAVQLSNWLVWREDWPDWRSLNEVEGLTEMIYRNLMAAPPPVPTTESIVNAGPQGLDTDGENSGFTTTMMDDDGDIKLTDSLIQMPPSDESSQSGQFVVRKNRRFKKRYEIAVIVGEKIFDTHCVDISVGGILLEENLPDWVRDQFKVRIKKPNMKQQIELTACVIEGQAPGQKNRIGILPLQSGDDEKNLESWLAA